MQYRDGLELQFISALKHVTKMDWNYFGRGLGSLRRKYGWLQKEVAYKSGFAPSYIAALEGGRRPPPPLETFHKIVEAVGATELEEAQLQRAAKLSEIARVIANHSNVFPGASAALSLLEVSPEMTTDEVDALRTLVDGYRFRALLPRRTDM